MCWSFEVSMATVVVELSAWGYMYFVRRAPGDRLLNFWLLGVIGQEFCQALLWRYWDNNPEEADLTSLTRGRDCPDSGFNETISKVMYPFFAIPPLALALGAWHWSKTRTEVPESRGHKQLLILAIIFSAYGAFAPYAPWVFYPTPERPPCSYISPKGHQIWPGFDWANELYNDWTPEPLLWLSMVTYFGSLWCITCGSRPRVHVMSITVPVITCALVVWFSFWGTLEIGSFFSTWCWTAVIGAMGSVLRPTIASFAFEQLSNDHWLVSQPSAAAVSLSSQAQSDAVSAPPTNDNMDSPNKTK